jgi:hypothetical protein
MLGSAFLHCNAVGFQAGVAHCKITRHGAKVGTIDYRKQLRSDGSVEMTYNFALSATKSIYTVVEDKDRTGTPIKADITMKFAKNNIVYSAIFGKSNFQISAQGRSNTVPYPAGTVRQQPSAFWFIRDHPQVGTTAKYSRLDYSSMKWVKERAVFLGNATVGYHGKSVACHKIAVNEATLWLDDQGLPYKSVSTTTGEVIERL